MPLGVTIPALRLQRGALNVLRRADAPSLRSAWPGRSSGTPQESVGRAGTIDVVPHDIAS
jgi:hypothetical protein